LIKRSIINTEIKMEYHSSQLPIDLQSDLVRRYCGDADAMIREAATMEQAESIGEEICGKLARECSSELVVNASRAYVKDIIHKRWGSG
jgi:hypothetical protein